MKLGVALPTSGSWASPETIGHVADQAEQIGLATVWAHERLLRPAATQPLGGGPPVMLPDSQAAVYDPLETLAYVAARTSHIQLGTSVIDALFHSPLVLARRLATLDRLSRGRLLIGLGQGWMEQEFTATGVPASRRGAGFEEHLAVMRAVWGPDPVQFAGRFFQIPEAEIGPKPVQDRGVPLLVGAAAPAAIERAARLGLGLSHVMFDWEGLRQTIDRFRRAAGEAGHDVGTLPIVVQVNGTLTPSPRIERAPLTGAVEQVAGDLIDLQALGVDQVFWWSMETEPREQLNQIARLQARAST